MRPDVFLILFLFAGSLLLFPVADANPVEGGIPLQTIKTGTVTGDLWFDSYPGFAKSAEKYFNVPKHTSIDWARLYVGVYCGHKQNNYEGIAHVALDLNRDGNYEIPLGDEKLNVPYSYPANGGSGPVSVNDHCNRVTSDYIMWYDLADKISDKPVGVSVKTEPVGSSFDGRIKFIALLVAYNDNDHDIVYYWVNQGHDPLNSEVNNGYTGETTFGTSSMQVENEEMEDSLEATLSAIYMASVDGRYTFNGEDLPGETPRGAYFGYDKWDVRDQIVSGDDSTLKYQEAGTYYKIPLALLTIRFPERDAGTLEVTSSPPGAQIILDGEYTDRVTNATFFSVDTGEHKIELDMAGNGSYRNPSPATVVITRNGKSSLHFRMGAINGSMNVRSDPQGAWVYVDGVNQSVATETDLDGVLAGNHTITLKMAGYEDATVEVAVRKDNPGSVAVNLTPRPLNATASAGGEAAGSGYGGTALTLYRHGVVNGGLTIANVSAYSGLLEKNNRKDYPLVVNLPKNSTVKEARLYVYTTWSYNTAELKGIPASLMVAYNENPLERERSYLDRKGSGVYDYPMETHCYRIDPAQVQPGTVHVSVVNSGQSRDTFAVYGAVLVIVYEDPAQPVEEYWIGEGSDMLYANPEFHTDSANATTRMEFADPAGPMDRMQGSLLVISTAASGSPGDDNRVTFNNRGWTNALTAGSSGISMARFDVTGSNLSADNMATIQSLETTGKGDYMENRNIILVLYNATRTGAADLPVAYSEIQEDTKNAPSAPAAANQAMLAPAASGPVEENIDPAKMSYSMRVVSNPPGAGISLDYTYTGKTTPAIIDPVSGGNHTVSVEMEGFAPAEKRIFVTTNESVKFSLDVSGSPVYSRMKIGSGTENLIEQEYFGGIYVDSNPSGAVIYVDGKKTLFVTPSIVYGISEGKHTVKVMRGSDRTKTGFPVESKEVFVDTGAITPVSFSISENPLLVNISIRSDRFNGSEFTLNGGRVRYRLPATMTLQYLSDNFIAVKNNDSFISIPLVVYNSIDQVQDLRFVPTSFQNLYVESEPSGSDIFIDGYATGYSTPYTIRNLSQGTHVVFITKPGYIPASSTVRINSEDVVRRFVLGEYLNGMLTVTSVPAGGKIYLNNKDTGEVTPFTFQYLQAGHYQVKVIENRIQATEPDVIVEPERCREINLTLKRKGVKYGMTS